jgi:hypothetical protein
VRRGLSVTAGLRVTAAGADEEWGRRWIGSLWRWPYVPGWGRSSDVGTASPGNGREKVAANLACPLSPVLSPVCAKP